MPRARSFAFALILATFFRLPKPGNCRRVSRRSAHALSHGRSVKIGYMYHHFSNANLTPDNYALDTHTIIAGFSWYKK